MTVLAVYRDVAIDSYGEAGSQLPNFEHLWAPRDRVTKWRSQPTWAEPIYTAEMTQEEKYVAAEQAALAFSKPPASLLKTAK